MSRYEDNIRRQRQLVDGLPKPTRQAVKAVEAEAATSCSDKVWRSCPLYRCGKSKSCVYPGDCHDRKSRSER